MEAPARLASAGTTCKGTPIAVAARRQGIQSGGASQTRIMSPAAMIRRVISVLVMVVAMAIIYIATWAASGPGMV